jgi:nickel-dependent lactate racemase
MVEVWLPYGDTEIMARIPAELFLGSIDPPQLPASANPEADIQNAIEKPLDATRLQDMVSEDSKIALIVEDGIPPSLLRLSLKHVLEALMEGGAKKQNVTLIFATGFEGMRDAENLAAILEKDAVASYKIIIHNPWDQENLLPVGETKRGTKVLLNRAFLEADIKICLGVLELHEFAGYTGVRTSILPGISGLSTIKASLGFLTDENARPGILEDNPVYSEILEANSMAEPDFALTLILNRHGNPVKAFGGEAKRVFEEGVRILDSMRKVPIKDTADIVLVAADGAPKDHSLSRAIGCLQNALEALRLGGFLILAAECGGGYGSKTFYDWMKGFKDIESLKRNIRRNYEFGCEKAYILARAIEKARVILVSSLPHFYTQEVFRVQRASTVSEALEISYHRIPKRPKVLVIPYGMTTLPLRIKVQREEGSQP